MRDIPGIALILGAFVPLALALLIYSQIGPKRLPEPQNTWQHISKLRGDLQSRTIKLNVGQSEDITFHPYQFHLERKADVMVNQPRAQYLIQVRPLRKIEDFNYWISDGLEISLIDADPTALIGSLKLVALKRIEKQDS